MIFIFDVKNDKQFFSFSGPDVLQAVIYAAVTQSTCIQNIASTQGILNGYKTQLRTEVPTANSQLQCHQCCWVQQKKSCNILKDYILGLSSKLTSVSS